MQPITKTITLSHADRHVVAGTRAQAAAHFRRHGLTLHARTDGMTNLLFWQGGALEVKTLGATEWGD